ncbi:MAG: OsmC family protein [Myxococcota bacterium]
MPLKPLEFPTNSSEPTLQRQVAHVERSYGIACDVRHADRTLRVDLPRSAGGGSTGPHPGQLLRASIGACLVMGCTQWAQRLGIALDDIQLEIAASYDERGQLGIDDSVPIGWQRLELDLVITSAAAEADVQRVVDAARRSSPMLANLSSTIEQIFRLQHITPNPSSSTFATKGTVP